MKAPLKPYRWLDSVNCAIEGIVWAAQTQKHMRWHCLCAVAVVMVALFFRITATEFMLLALAVTLVLFAELINTAVEVLVDLVSPEYHPLAKRAKDVAAGGVLVTAIGAVVMGYFALSHYLFPPLGRGMGMLNRPPGELAVFSVLAVTLLVVLLKSRFGSGSPLHGGMPSGHSAIAFSIATSICLSQVGPVVSLLAVGIATMVSHSRLLLGIHNFKEVLAGGLLGVAVTIGFYICFG
jgi:diacylglycerol kinase (ATP)